MLGVLCLAAVLPAACGRGDDGRAAAAPSGSDAATPPPPAANRETTVPAEAPGEKGSVTHDAFRAAFLPAASERDDAGRPATVSSGSDGATQAPPTGNRDTTAPAEVPREEGPMTYDAFRRLVEDRRSIRRFTEDDVGEAEVARILEAVRLCPTAGNEQAYEVVVVRDPKRRAALAAAAFGQPWVEQAPVVLAFVALPAVSGARYGERGSRLYAVQDATIAATYAMLAATTLGLGSVWVGAFDTRAVARALECAAGEVPVALLPIGRPAESPAARPRRSLEEMSRRL